MEKRFATLKKTQLIKLCLQKKIDLSSNTSIKIYLMNSSNAQIFLKHQGKSFTIPFNPKVKLNDFKLFVEKKMNLLKGMYYLTFNGKGMYENKSLEDFYVERDCNIHIHIRPMVPSSLPHEIKVPKEKH